MPPRRDELKTKERLLMKSCELHIKMGNVGISLRQYQTSSVSGGANLSRPVYFATNTMVVGFHKK